MADDEVICELCKAEPAQYEERVGKHSLLLCKLCFGEISELINRRFRCNQKEDKHGDS